MLADGVALENLTARNATLNGFFWTGVTGYRGRYLTAYNNGDYGIYAFDSKDGLLEDSYASGSPDAGFYIGQCFPCQAVIRRVTSEHNAVGYSGTNAGGDLYILNSVWRHNRGGLVPNTLDTELYPPQRATTIRHNLVYDNNSRTAPGKGLSPLAWGNGVVLGGGRQNLVEHNVIVHHAGHGVVVAPLADANFWPALDNRVRENRISKSGRADITVGGPMSKDNCIERHADGTTLAPASLRCNGSNARGQQNDITLTVSLAMRIWRLRNPSYPDWKTQPVPPPQPTMPDAATAPALPAVGEFARVRDAVSDTAMPTIVDSVLAVYAETATPGPAPRLARVQAMFPFSLGRVGAALVLIVLCVVLGRVRARAGQNAAPLKRTARVLGAIVAAWTGLMIVIATLFSAM